MRTIIIGDIRGCDKELRALLDQVRPGQEDRLIGNKGKAAIMLLSLS